MEYFENDVIKELIKSKIELAKIKFGKEFSNCLIELLSLEKMLSENNQLNENRQQKINSNDNSEKKSTESTENEGAEVITPKYQRQIPLSKWDKYYPDPSVNALRMLDYKRAENGFNEYNVTERRGTRVLVNEDNYFAWRAAYKK